jgi:hypothetical protein
MPYSACVAVCISSAGKGAESTSGCAVFRDARSYDYRNIVVPAGFISARHHSVCSGADTVWMCAQNGFQRIVIQHAGKAIAAQHKGVTRLHRFDPDIDFQLGAIS